MRKLNQKLPLSFPKLNIDPRNLLLEFVPKIYLEREIKKLEDELKVVNVLVSPYSIAIKQQYLKYCKEQLCAVLDEDKQEYEKRYKEKFEDTENRAIKGDDEAIFRLVRWNKDWLFKDWVKNKIVISEALSNREFLKGISQAMKETKRKSTQVQLVAFLRKLKATGYPFDDKQKIKELRIFLHKFFISSDIDDNHIVFGPLLSNENFSKLLIRNELRGDIRFRK